MPKEYPFIGPKLVSETEHKKLKRLPPETVIREPDAQAGDEREFHIDRGLLNSENLITGNDPEWSYMGISLNTSGVDPDNIHRPALFDYHEAVSEDGQIHSVITIDAINPDENSPFAVVQVEYDAMGKLRVVDEYMAVGKGKSRENLALAGHAMADELPPEIDFAATVRKFFERTKHLKNPRMLDFSNPILYPAKK